MWSKGCTIALIIKDGTRTTTGINAARTGIRWKSHLKSTPRGGGVCSGTTGLTGGLILGSAAPVREDVLSTSPTGLGAGNEETSVVRSDIWGGRERVQNGTMATGHLLSSCRKEKGSDFISVCDEALNSASFVFVCSNIPRFPTI